MKKVIWSLLALLVMLAFGSCEQQKTREFRIHGTVNGGQYEGKRVFLVPLYGPKTAEYVDSVEVKDGKFEFVTDSMKMYKILLDYHYRYGTQTLLVVGEPGDIEVVIDSVSHAHGAPQNDSLEKWKDVTEKHNREFGRLNRAIQTAKQQGNAAEAEALKAEADRMHLGYKQFSRRMAENLKEGPLHDFLDGMFPLTYKRKLPDGSVVTFDADTNEPVEE